MLRVMNVSRAASRAQLWKALTLTRSFHVSRANYDVMPYLMPAMSPTMEKGGIVDWKVKVGDSFQSGDVLLEIETDKAQIDVEAQDEGILVKILKDNGVKDIAIGEVIAFTAEIDDDLSSVNLDELVASSKMVPEPKIEVAPVVKKNTPPVKAKTETHDNSIVKQANTEQTLLPSVSLILAVNGISKGDALRNINASGIRGQLLKGDVLEYLGKISEGSVAGITKYVKQSEKLDLSNVQAKPLEAKVEVSKSDAIVTPDTEFEPFVIEEDVYIEVPSDVTFEKLQKSIKLFLEDAYQYAHLETNTKVQSDYFDSVFEELITPEPRSARFDYSYTLLPLDGDGKITKRENDDIFDVLSGKTVQTEEKNDKVGYIISLDVNVNDKFGDAEDKANTFLDSVIELEDTQGL